MAVNGMTSLVDFGEFFVIPKIFYNLMGMDPYRDESATSFKKNLAYVLFTTAFLNMNMVLWMEIMDMTTASPLDFNAILVYALCQFFGEIKVFIIWLNRSNVNSFIEIMKIQFPTTPESHAAFGVSATLKNMLRFERVYLLVLLLGGWSFNLLPAAWSIIENSLDSSNGFVMRFPFYRWYPFKVNSLWIYSATYFQQMHGGCICVNCYISSDLFLVSVVSVLLMYLRYIHKQLRTMVVEGTDKDLVKLKTIMNFHRMTLSTAELINTVFSRTILLNFMASVVIICLSGFQATAKDVPVVQLLSFFLLLLHELVQTAVMCYLGQILMDYVSCFGVI